MMRSSALLERPAATCRDGSLARTVDSGSRTPVVRGARDRARACLRRGDPEAADRVSGRIRRSCTSSRTSRSGGPRASLRCSSRIARRSRAVTTSRASTRSGPLGDAFPTRPIWLGRIGRRPAGRRRQRPGPESAPADRRAGEVRPGPRAPRALGGHRRDGDPSPGPDRRLSARTQPGVRDATPVLKLVEGARPPPRRRADYCNSTYLAELAPDRGPLAASHPRDPQRGGPGAIRAAPRRRRRTGRASSSWPTSTPTRVTIGSSARWRWSASVCRVPERRSSATASSARVSLSSLGDSASATP